MASRVIQTEEIQSGTGVITASELNKFAISPDLTIDDLAGEQLVTKNMLLASLPSITILPDLSFVIALGTASPFVYDMTTHADYGLMPWVQKAIEDVGSDGTRLRNASDIEHDYNYTDNTKTALVNIEINGHLDDSGNFAEDTYVTIKQNLQ